jgi:hypothetical protein
MRTISSIFVMSLLLISAQIMLGSRLQQNEEQQAEPTTGQATSRAAVQTVTGCVVKSDHGYSLKTENETDPIETDQDLSNYVNKQVKLTGILEHHTAAAPSAGNGNAATVTDIRLRMIATVIGNCNQPSK